MFPDKLFASNTLVNIFLTYLSHMMFCTHVSVYALPFTQNNLPFFLSLGHPEKSQKVLFKYQLLVMVSLDHYSCATSVKYIYLYCYIYRYTYRYISISICISIYIRVCVCIYTHTFLYSHHIIQMSVGQLTLIVSKLSYSCLNSQYLAQSWNKAGSQ